MTVVTPLAQTFAHPERLTVIRCGLQPSAVFFYRECGNASDGTLYGDTPRNCIIGPPQKNIDFTLGKMFKITEGQAIRFRADFFNLFNHPSFANPAAPSVGGSPLCPVAGVPCGLAPITSTIGTPRLIQFSLKYSF